MKVRKPEKYVTLLCADCRAEFSTRVRKVQPTCCAACRLERAREKLAGLFVPK